ncbi:hypothetical protein GCM10010324_10860 [Streptomyces hiroshimensis]|uniref:Uncharacterized protein n=1 Tax=Streptomyces hiroshimensis TaxID=66424 RepID=A0ABQ2Y5P4_9ACTN|nr:hypothetical protein GCM10010324_10860 [Streptomyces hiroshimensis]
MVVWTLVLTVWVPVEPLVTYQPLKWVIVGVTSDVLITGCRVPRSAAVQDWPAWGACAVAAGAAAAGEVARPTAVMEQAAEAVMAMSALPMRLAGLIGRIVALPPCGWCVFGQRVNVAATRVGV